MGRPERPVIEFQDVRKVSKSSRVKYPVVFDEIIVEEGLIIL